MSWHERIIVDPEILTGKPVVRGTRLAVELIVGLLAEGWTHEALFNSYPGLTEADILACLSYAQDRLSSERVYPLSA